jgi:uncharacterized membrane protein YbhN (UPF0104 family)
MRSLYRWFVYATLVFLVYYLVRQRTFVIPQIHSVPMLAYSILLLVAGFYGGVVTWRKVLARSGFESRFSECLASMGLSVFGKYVPGKFWLILGRAAYIAERRRAPIGEVSTASLNDQFIGLWSGLLLGTIGLLWVGGIRLYGWLTLIAWLAMTLLAFSPVVHRLVEMLLASLLRRNIKIPALDLKSTLRILPWALGYWAVWSIGFLLLAQALSKWGIPLSAGLGFPLAGSLGVLAVIAPGGLGVREGVIVGYLTLAGIPLPQALAVSVASRLWFLAGEVIFFASGVVANRRTAK